MPTYYTLEDNSADDLDIAIRVKNGVAIITGTAGSLAEKHLAEKAAYTMVNADDVYNLVKTEQPHR